MTTHLPWRQLGAPLIALLAAACGTAPQASQTQSAERRDSARPTATADAPVVLELFQSQGCSSCPPANANVNALAQRPEILALSYGVTYWDRLGWKDSFARPEHTARQWDYARAAGRDHVATPQLVINGGRETVVGADRGEVERVAAAAGSPKNGPAISASARTVQIAAGSGKPATVWLVRYDPGVRQVSIGAGENGGRTLPHRNVVRELVKLGEWTGSAATFALPAAREAGLATAVLVQRGTGGPIIAARRV